MVGIVESDNYYYHGGALSSKTGTAALPPERVWPVRLGSTAYSGMMKKKGGYIGPNNGT